MRFQCTNCLGVVAIDESEAGHAVACGHCSRVIVVPQTRLSPTAVLGDFVIEKELGRGGLATVYLAHQISLDRSAALKVLFPQFSADREFIVSFIKEARVAAQLNHPNIVQAYAVGEDEGIHYFAMEYVQGHTLKTLLANVGRLVVDRSLEITREVATALDVAWTSTQLVHRDVKPDNIMVTESGQVKLADLGLARAGSDLRESEETEILGTPQYIAPELLLGWPGDHRADIYSLGATLYHMVTGKYPYTGTSATDIARKHICEPLVSPRRQVSDLPPPVADLIEVMMAKRPGHRYQSAAEVLDEIKRIKAHKEMVRKPMKVFQVPIDLTRLDEDMAMPTPDKDIDAAPKARQMLLRKPGASGPAPAAATAPAAASGTAAAGRRIAIRLKGRDGQADGTGTAVAGPETAAVLPDTVIPPGAAVPAPARARRRGLSTKAMLGLLVGGAVVLAAAAAVVIYVLAQRKKANAFEDELARLGLTASQYEALGGLDLLIRTNADDADILAKGAELVAAHPGVTSLERQVTERTAAAAEREVRALRADLRTEELTAWRKRSRELQDKVRQDEQARVAALKAEEEAERQRQLEEAQAKAREERLAQLRSEQGRLRADVVRFCREHRYDGARAQFTAMAAAREEEFRDWARGKQHAIDLAEEAFKLVSDSGELLKGERIAVKSRPQKVTIVAVGPRDIAAEIRETVYERGKPIGEKVDPLNVPLTEVETAQLVKLMLAAAAKKGVDDDRAHLVIGAYLLCRAEAPALIQTHLNTTGLADEARPLLDEYEAMKAATPPTDTPTP